MVRPWCRRRFCPLARLHLVAAALALVGAGCVVPLIQHSSDPPPPASTTPHARADARRPADAAVFGGHGYKVFEEEVSWYAAKARCEAMGGYLACIETAAEQAFIATLADERYLSLGATDEQEEDVWLWVNGSPFDFTAWMEGQPNNYGGSEHYLATYDEGAWVDVAVEGSGFWMPTGFICEWEK